MSDKILKLNQAQTLYNDLRERIEALPTDNDIPTKISDLTDDSGHYTKPATGIPASDLSEEIISTIDGKAPAIYCEKSGAIVSFDDGAGNMPLKECVVNIEPVQDLHGYDSPWPAGGGKNLLNTVGLAAGTPSSITATTATPRTFTVGTYVTKLSQNNYYNNPVTLQCSVSDNAISVTSSAVAYGVSIPVIGLEIGETYVLSAQKTNGNLYVSFYQQDGTFISNTNKNPENFTIPADTYYTLLHFQTATNDEEGSFTNIQLEKSSTATPYAPYSNICSITGWTGAKVNRTGKNLLPNKSFPLGMSTLYLGQDTNGHDISLKAGTYTISYFANAAASIYYAKSGSPSTSLGNGFSKTITLAEDGDYRFWLYRSSGIPEDVKEWQLERGSTATTYEPYQGETYDITFPAEAGTVYGGTLDVVRGVLTVDRVTYELQTVEQRFWFKSSSYPGGYFTNYVRLSSKGQLKAQTPFICSHAKTALSVKEYAPGTCFSDNAINIRIMTEESTISDWVQYLGEQATNGTPVTICGYLAEPITYTLTPQEIKTFLGTNNIWADTGDTFIKYCVDTKSYVDESLPDVPVQDVQVNGTSIVTNSVANVPVAGTNTLGVVRRKSTSTVSIDNDGYADTIRVSSISIIKNGNSQTQLLVPIWQHGIAFYGLAKAAGADMKDIANTIVGTYPDAQKEAIQSMLGITQMLAPTNPNLVASQAYSIGDVFAANGHLYKATAAIAQDGAIIPDTNCVETTMAEAGGKIKDVQVNGTSVVSNGVANIPAAALGGDYGTVKLRTTTASSGLTINTDGTLSVAVAQPQNYHVGTSSNPMSIYYMNYATFYGLARAAGQTSNINATGSYNTVGQYTEEAKTAIKAMLGVQDGLKVVRLI